MGFGVQVVADDAAIQQSIKGVHLSTIVCLYLRDLMRVFAIDSFDVFFACR